MAQARGLLFWCQHSRRRILTVRASTLAPVRASYPVLTLVNDTVCTGLALDTINGYFYWTASTGHLLYRASYLDYNASYAAEVPGQSIFSLTHTALKEVRLAPRRWLPHMAGAQQPPPSR